MEEILETYYENNARKLRRVVDKILSGYGKSLYKDRDDFYSLANEVFADVIKRYDDSRSFDGFLYVCLSNKIKAEVTKRNRKKRTTDCISVSIDMPVGDDEGSTLGDIIVDCFDVEQKIIGELEGGYSKKMLLYLNKLSKLQNEVLRLSIAGYLPDEIQEELQISEKQYIDCKAAIHSYRNVSVLF